MITKTKSTEENLNGCTIMCQINYLGCLYAARQERDTEYIDSYVITTSDTL